MIKMGYKCGICNIEITGQWPLDGDALKLAVEEHDRSHEIKPGYKTQEIKPDYKTQEHPLTSGKKDQYI